MPSPFYDAIRGTCTTAGAPGTGAFTPDAAAPSGYRPWSKVPAGWIGMVRFDDGTAWELSWSYWNGTTISRSANQLYDSSTGSRLSLTATATATMVIEGSGVMSHIGETAWCCWKAQVNSSSVSAGIAGIPNPTPSGTNTAQTLTTTSYLTEQPRLLFNSATTANAAAGLTWTGNSSWGLCRSSAGHGGWECTIRFGASALPTGPRLLMGMIGGTGAQLGVSTEPSAAAVPLACFGKDSTDTNIQLMTNNGTGGCTKIDTGIPWAANGWYEACLWEEPGSLTVYALLIRYDTGDIFYTSTSTDVPNDGVALFPEAQGSLNATNTGTAMALHIGSVVIRSGQ